MAFRFALESILVLRRGLERAEHLRLEAIVMDLRRISASLEELTGVSIKSQRQLQLELIGSLDGAEMQFQETRESSMKSFRAGLQQRLATLEQERLKQVQVLYRIRQGREVLENLRARQLLDYSLIHARKEQQEQDDIFLLRRHSGDVAPG